MRIGIFSDIHGNQYAFRSFISILPSLNIDELIFCGDIFGYYYGQREIIESLIKIPDLHWILGNHDQNYLDLFNKDADKNLFVEKYGNSYDLVSIPSLQIKSLLGRLPHMLNLNFAGTNICIVHGTFQDPLNGRLYPKDISSAELLPADVLIMGHTHFRLAIWKDRILFLNPGSLGQPRDKFPSGMAILTLPDCLVEFVDIAYDKTELEAEIRRNDPDNHKLIEILHRAD